MSNLQGTILLTLVLIGQVGCQGDMQSSEAEGNDSAVAETMDNDSGMTETPVVAAAENETTIPPAEKVTGGLASPGKPGPPVDISYAVVGNPIVGNPVAINVVVTSALSPLTVQYSINDTSALMFQTGQVERLEIADATEGSMQQLTVIPQREGRLYVNVSAEVPADMGTMIRSLAIPIKVGSAPKEATLEGDLKTGPDGEAVISLPAQ